MTRVRRLMIVSVLVAALGSGCSIQPEAAPNDLPAERSNVFGDPATGDEAAGTNRVYLLVPADTDQPDRLRSVLRDVPTEPTAVLESLFAGPNTEERDEGLDTAIPADVELQSTPRTVGQVLTIDVNDVFDALNTESLQTRRRPDREHRHHHRRRRIRAVAHRRRTPRVADRQRRTDRSTVDRVRLPGPRRIEPTGIPGHPLPAGMTAAGDGSWNACVRLRCSDPRWDGTAADQCRGSG